MYKLLKGVIEPFCLYFCVTAFLLETLNGAEVLGTVSMQERLPGGTVVFGCGDAITNDEISWVFTADGNEEMKLTDGENGIDLQDNDEFLKIESLNSGHEGLYTCKENGNSYNVTILALPKFAGCSNSDKDCDMGDLYSNAIGQNIQIKIDIEFYGGGNRSKKQDILLKLKKNSGELLRCSKPTSCSDSSYERVTYSVSEPYQYQINISGAQLADSGRYTATIQYDQQTASVAYYFTVNVTEMVATATTSSTGSIILSTTNTHYAASSTTSSYITGSKKLPPTTSSQIPFFSSSASIPSPLSSSPLDSHTVGTNKKERTGLEEKEKIMVISISIIILAVAIAVIGLVIVLMLRRYKHASRWTSVKVKSFDGSGQGFLNKKEQHCTTPSVTISTKTDKHSDHFLSANGVSSLPPVQSFSSETDSQGFYEFGAKIVSHTNNLYFLSQERNSESFKV